MSTKKRAIIFTAFLLVISFFLIAFSTAQDRVGCCTETQNGNYCIDYAYESQCQTNQFHSGVCSALPECKLITCATPDGCLFNYPKLTCEKNNGSISLQAMPAVCNKGCCGIANRGYGVITKKECQDQTTELGYEQNQMTFIEGLIDERQCDLKFASTDRGCCYNGAATCTYGTRADCEASEGTFRQGIYCSQIVECESTAQFKDACGILFGDKNKRCWFDSLGNQEDCFEECAINSEMCAPNMTNYARVGSMSYCKSTACGTTFNLYNGQSYCYYPYEITEDSNNKADFLDRSTGLQFTKLVCNYGDLQTFGLGADRNTICENKNDNHATTKDNKWENCQTCGKGKSVTDFIGEFFGAGLTYMDLSKLSGTALLSLNAPLSKLAKFCDESTCTGLGDCVYQAEIKGGKVFQSGAWINTQNIGASCSPEYSPGTTAQCGSCGAGGDGLFNVCDKQECYRMGDCSFEDNNLIVKTGIGTAYALGLATSAKFNMIPVYVAADCIKTGPGYFTCVSSGIGEETTNLLIGPIKILFENVFGVISGGKTFGLSAATQAISEVKSVWGIFK